MRGPCALFPSGFSRRDLIEVLFEAEGRGVQGPLRMEFGVWDHRLVRVEVPERVEGGLRGELSPPIWLRAFPRRG